MYCVKECEHRIPLMPARQKNRYVQAGCSWIKYTRILTISFHTPPQCCPDCIYGDSFVFLWSVRKNTGDKRQNRWMNTAEDWETMTYVQTGERGAKWEGVRRNQEGSINTLQAPQERRTKLHGTREKQSHVDKGIDTLCITIKQRQVRYYLQSIWHADIQMRVFSSSETLISPKQTLAKHRTRTRLLLISRQVFFFGLDWVRTWFKSRLVLFELSMASLRQVSNRSWFIGMYPGANAIFWSRQTSFLLMLLVGYLPTYNHLNANLCFANSGVDEETGNEKDGKYVLLGKSSQHKPFALQRQITGSL